MKRIMITIPLLLLCLFSACSIPKAEPVSQTAFVLNTVITITLNDTQDKQILTDAITLCKQLDQQFSRTDSNGEIYRINHRPTGETQFLLTDTSAYLMQKSLYYAELSNGAFDITIEPLSRLWDFHAPEPVVPSASSIEDARKKVDYHTLSLRDNTLSISSPNTRLDFGAIAKGYIGDRLKDYLISQGVTSAIIDLGGNIICIGSKTDGSAYRIGIQDPFHTDQIAASVSVTDASVVTSGIYERNFTQDDIFYHHILNPATGYPCDNGLVSVSILAADSIDADALSTTCFVLGQSDGLKLVNSLDDVYALFITEDGSFHYSDGADAFFITQ